MIYRKCSHLNDSDCCRQLILKVDFSQFLISKSKAVMETKLTTNQCHGYFASLNNFNLSCCHIVSSRAMYLFGKYFQPHKREERVLDRTKRCFFLKFSPYSFS